MAHSAEYVFNNSWNDGMQFQIFMTISENIVGGWQLVLNFSAPFTHVNVANAKVADATDYKCVRVVNSDYNSDLWAGQDISVDFVVEFDSKTAPRLISAQFQGVAVTGTVLD